MQNKYNSGEIVDIDLGLPPQEVKGHEQGLQRPCVIIKSIPQLQLAVIVPCTSKEPKFSHYTIVKLLKGIGGLKTDSYVLCHQVRAISFDRIIGRVGTINDRDLLKIKTVLFDTLDL